MTVNLFHQREDFAHSPRLRKIVLFLTTLVNIFITSYKQFTIDMGYVG